MTQRQRLAELIERAYREGARDALRLGPVITEQSVPLTLMQAVLQFPLAEDKKE